MSLTSVMGPLPVVTLCTLGVLFRGEIIFMNCDDICMCVVNRKFEPLEFVFNSVYFELKYNENVDSESSPSLMNLFLCTNILYLI